MKKRLFILICFIILSLGIMSGCSSADTSTSGGKTKVWRIGHEEIAGGVQDLYAYEFKRLVEEKSNGKIKVEVYRANEIGGATDYLEFVQGGLLNFALVNPGSSGTTVPENNVFYNHFLLPEDDRDVQEFLKTSKSIKLLNEINEENEMKVLDWFYQGYNAWTSNNEIRKPADFKGVSIRTMQSPLIVASYAAYGANPTPMPYMEVYSGLQLKQIDAQVNPIFAIQEMGFYEVQKYLIQAKQDGFISGMIANKEHFDKLSDEDKKMVEEVIGELNEFIYNVQHELNEKRLELIRENSDIKIIELTPEEREEFRKASAPAREVYRKSVGDRGNKILDSFEAEIAELENNKK